MKIPKTHLPKRNGFTLVELLVAMSIAVIIMGILVGITNVAMGAWTRGRAEVRAARQAKSMVEAMAKDLETFVVRSGNNFEWLYAKTEATLPGGDNARSSNACELICFSAATDRYKGGAGTTTDLGGDICTASYKLAYQDPIAAQQNNDSAFVFYRQLLDPRPTFDNVLGKTDLRQAFTTAAGANRFENRTTADQNTAMYNFVCENIYQYSITFRVDVSRTVGNVTTIIPVRVTLGQNGQATATEFRVYGDRIVTDAKVGSLNVTAAELAAGRLSGVEIALTVISDKGFEQMKKRNMSDAERAKFLAQNSFQYSKLIEVPGM